MSRYLILHGFLTLLLLGGCMVDRQGGGSGCDTDADCRPGRVCADRHCRFSEEAAIIEPAEHAARRLAASLAIAEPRALATLLPMEADLDSGFDWRDADGFFGDRSRLDELESRVYGDFAQLAAEGRFAGGRLAAFEPGRALPLPVGHNLALRGLDSLADSRLWIETDKGLELLVIRRLVLLRGRWKLMALLRE